MLSKLYRGWILSAIGVFYSERSQSLSSELSSSAISFLLFKFDARLLGRLNSSSSESDSDDEDEFISTIVDLSELADFRFETVLLPFPPVLPVDFRAGLPLVGFALNDVDFAFAAFAFAALAPVDFDFADIQPSPSDMASGFEGVLLEDPAFLRCGRIGKLISARGFVDDNSFWPSGPKTR